MITNSPTFGRYETKRAIAIALALLIVSIAVPGRASTDQNKWTPLRLMPTDEARSEPALNAVRGAMLDAMKRGDVDGLLQHFQPGQWEFYGGAENLRASLRGPNQFWGALEYVLTHGGAFTTTHGKVRGRREFCAPYVYGAYPNLSDEALDPSFPWVITGSAVAVRTKPVSSAPLIRTLSYELIQASGYVGGDEGWAAVTLADGREGYVARDDIRDPADYHACFAEVSGRWMLVEFDRDKQPERDAGPRTELPTPLTLDVSVRSARYCNGDKEVYTLDLTLDATYTNVTDMSLRLRDRQGPVTLVRVAKSAAALVAGQIEQAPLSIDWFGGGPKPQSRTVRLEPGASYKRQFVTMLSAARLSFPGDGYLLHPGAHALEMNSELEWLDPSGSVHRIVYIRSGPASFEMTEGPRLQDCKSRDEL